jgi:uncharacterized protein
MELDDGADSSSDWKSLNVYSGPLTAHACRLEPGADILDSIHSASITALQQQSTCPSNSVIILTCVGSLSSLTLRMANARPIDNDSKHSPLRTWDKPLEVVSLVGTIAIVDRKSSSPAIQYHLHMSVSDDEGNVYGGHFVKGIVHTTMELVLGTVSNVNFDRVHDPNTGYRELVISNGSV